jgi:acetate kinase
MYTLSEDKLLVSYSEDTPSKFGDIKEYIESLPINNNQEILSLLSEYQTQIRTLIQTIRKISKDYLTITASPSNEDIQDYFSQLQGSDARIVTKTINEISKTLRNLEYELLDTRGMKPDLNGLQVKTSQIGAQLHMDKNGGESTPVTIGNTPQAIRVIQATALDETADPSKKENCNRYLEALDFMCDELLT